MANFSLGFSTIFPLPPFCFVEYSITAPAQAHVSAGLKLGRDHMRFFSHPSRAEISIKTGLEIMARAETLSM